MTDRPYYIGVIRSERVRFAPYGVLPGTEEEWETVVTVQPASPFAWPPFEVRLPGEGLDACTLHEAIQAEGRRRGLWA